jgi:hypothetical protein
MLPNVERPAVSEANVKSREDLRLAVCVPSHGGWRAGFGQSLANLAAHFTASRFAGGRKQIEIFCVSGSILPDVRHRLAAQALKWSATHLLWLDSDMMFPRDAANRLLAHGLPVVAGNYVRRTHPHLPTAFDGAPRATMPNDRGLCEVDHMGMGLMLTDMRVYDILELPYFHFDASENGLGLTGEDVWFCHRLRERGIKLFIDHDLSQHIHHIGETAFHHRDYQPSPAIEAA